MKTLTTKQRKAADKRRKNAERIAKKLTYKVGQKVTLPAMPSEGLKAETAYVVQTFKTMLVVKSRKRDKDEDCFEVPLDSKGRILAAIMFDPYY